MALRNTLEAIITAESTLGSIEEREARMSEMKDRQTAVKSKRSLENRVLLNLCEQGIRLDRKPWLIRGE